MARGDSVHQGSACGFVRGVERQEFQMCVGANRVLQRVGLVLLYISGDYRGAFMKKSECHCPAQSAGASGHKGDLFREFSSHDASRESLLREGIFCFERFLLSANKACRINTVPVLYFRCPMDKII